jgi:hypothetical protein
VLQEIFTKYGSSTRHCYFLASSEQRRTWWEERIPVLLRVISNIRRLAGDVANDSANFTADSVRNVSSQLITIVPDADRNPRLTLVSRHITNHLFGKILQSDAESFWDFFNQFFSVSQSHASAGWLWEAHVLRELHHKVNNIHLPLRHLQATQSPSSSKNRDKQTLTNYDTVEVPFEKIFHYGDQESLTNGILNNRSQRTLFVPAAKNQATFDAFSISNDEVTLFQATISPHHSVKPVGLDFIWDALAKQALPKSNAKWHLVFVIPARINDDWNNYQTIDFGVKAKRRWNHYID